MPSGVLIYRFGYRPGPPGLAVGWCCDVQLCPVRGEVLREQGRAIGGLDRTWFGARFLRHGDDEIGFVHGPEGDLFGGGTPENCRHELPNRVVERDGDGVVE